MTNQEPNLCLSCGACCALYRVSFYWGEGSDAPGGTVPTHLTEKLDDFRIAMLGTSGSCPRCVALLGEIGDGVRCTIYDARSSACREFEPSWSHGERNERCDRARATWGLTPLEPPAKHEPAKDRPKRRRRVA